MITPPISLPTPVTGIESGPTQRVDRTNLAEEFGKALKDASAAEHNATTAAEGFAKGDPSIGIHEVVIASEKANIAVRYATTLKNGKLEIFYNQPQTEVCIHAIFPHAGYRPCWYATRNTVRTVSEGQALRAASRTARPYRADC